MMDTVLNLGLNEKVLEHFKNNNERFAYDSYRRFIQMFSDVVMEIDKSLFEEEIDKMKAEKQVKLDTDLTTEDLKRISKKFKKYIKKKIGQDFPEDPYTQLIEAVKAVFRSWNNPKQ